MNNALTPEGLIDARRSLTDRIRYAAAEASDTRSQSPLFAEQQGDTRGT